MKIVDCKPLVTGKRLGINENEYPSLSRWLKQMLNMTQVRETIPNSWWWWW